MFRCQGLKEKAGALRLTWDGIKSFGVGYDEINEGETLSEEWDQIP